ncbi:MAG: hypothetical protein NVSMB1_24240 [Polyangiales bacterium]
MSTLKGRPSALFPFIEGVQSCQLGVDELRAHAVGVALANVHAAATSFAERREGRFEAAHLRERLPRIASAKDPAIALMASVYAAHLDRWELARAPRLPTGVIHGDLFRDNVLWKASEGPHRNDIVAIIDFESASCGRFAYDLAVAVLAWCFGDTLDATLVRAMVSGYQSKRPLHPEEREGFRAELAMAAIRFGVTRLTDYALRTNAIGERVVKDWRRFHARLAVVETQNFNDAFA